VRRRLAPLVAASVALTLAACGDGDDDGSGDASVTTTVARAPAGEAPATGQSTTTTPRPERFEVETHEETYVDTSRPTDANGDFAGAPDRTLRVVFHVPKGDGPFPVVVFSHGWIATPEVYLPVLTRLAEHGYLAVAPAYPLSNGAAPGGPITRDVVNQPADASFVLDQVIAASRDESHWLSGLVDEDRVAAGGHSLGGFTTLGFFNSCCTDDRVDAAFPVAGSMASFPGEWFEGTDTPILLVHGDQDELVPYSRSADAYAQANAPKYFLTLLGGKHADFALNAEGRQFDITMDVILAFLDGYLRDDTAALEEIDELGNVAGVSTLVSA